MTVAEKPPVAVRLQQALALYRQGHIDAAETLYGSILVDDPSNPHATHILGIICEQRGDFQMAEQLIWRSVQVAPHSRAYLNLGVIQQHQGRLNEAIASYRQAIDIEPDYAEAWTNLIFSLDLHPHATPSLLKETRQQFDAAVCARLTDQHPPHQNDRTPDRRLKVGYVSGDFRLSHSAGMALHWIAAHDPEAVEVFCYSTYEQDDPTAEPFKQRADVWAEVGQLQPHELAQAVYEDQIDILVDLSGHSKGGRPLTFAMKPAPIQISGWGYSTGLGIKAIDYLVADHIVMPPEHADNYPERLLYLPTSIMYSPPATLPEVGESPESVRGYRTYGYLGRPVKLTDATLAAWAEILRRDPTSRLLLKSPQYADRLMRERVLHGLGALGVSMDRIEVQGVTPRIEHLEAHREVDVCLDSFPQSGGMTVCDSLLMGVPVVTLAGETAASRTSASILHTVGGGSWETRTVEAYVDIAVRCEPLSRPLLRKWFMDSLLVKHREYARAVEDAYRRIWREHVEAAWT